MYLRATPYIKVETSKANSHVCSFIHSFRPVYNERQRDIFYICVLFKYVIYFIYLIGHRAWLRYVEL